MPDCPVRCALFKKIILVPVRSCTCHLLAVSFFYSQSCLMVSIHTYNPNAQLFWLHRMLHVWNTATCNELPQTTTAEAAHPPISALPSMLGTSGARLPSRKMPFNAGTMFAVNGDLR